MSGAALITIVDSTLGIVYGAYPGVDCLTARKSQRLIYFRYGAESSVESSELEAVWSDLRAASIGDTMRVYFDWREMQLIANLIAANRRSQITVPMVRAAPFNDVLLKIVCELTIGSWRYSIRVVTVVRVDFKIES